MKKLINLKNTVFLFTLLAFSMSYAQVGIGTTNPSTQLDVEGAVSLREGGAITLVNGTNNNIVLPLTAGTVYSNYRITGPTGFFTIRSIVPATAADGQIVTLQNTTTQVMILEHNVGGPGANRIFIPGEEDLVLTGRYSSVTLMYSDNQNRWIVQNKLNDVTSWYYPPTDILAATTYNLTATIPNCTSFSSVSVSLVGDWSAATQPTDEITIHHIEARNGEVRFVVSNNTGFFGGSDYLGMDFIITVIN